MRFKLITLTIVVLFCGGSQSAAEVDANLLQTKLNRLYFSVGNESMVFPNASFVLICGADTLARGLIDFAAPGIAVSRPDSILAGFDKLSDCHAIIETAEIDSISSIRIGVIDNAEPLCRRLVALNPKPDSNTALRVIEFIPFANKVDLAVAFDSGGVDLALTLADLPVTRKATKHETAAPLIAVMIPNPASEINRHALLTTSLYYRYSSPTTSLFDGLSPNSTYCLFPRKEVCRRAYPYNPASGRKLAERLRKNPNGIEISYFDPSLKEAALFFTDILARDRISAKFILDNDSADLFLKYITYDPVRPAAGLGEIITLLLPLAGNNNETIISAANNIASAEYGDEWTTLVEGDRASSRLTEDIGVFPLFRINYLVLAQDYMSSLQFAPGGALLLDSLVIIQMPAGGPEE